MYSLYALLISLVAWMSVANLGVGPNLSFLIARSRALGDQSRQTRLMSSAFFPILGLALTIAVCGTWFSCRGPMSMLVGTSHSAFDTEVRACLVVLVVLATAQLLLSVAEAGQAGYQEQYKINTAGTVGSLLSLVGIGSVTIFHSRSLVAVMIALQAPVVFARAVNACMFFGKKGHLRPRLAGCASGEIRPLFAVGIMYAISVSLGSYANHQWPVVAGVRTLAPPESAGLAAVMGLFLQFFGIVSMFTFPLIPALSDAVARSDRSWQVRSELRLARWAMLYALVGCGAAIIAGPTILNWWLVGRVVISRQLAVGAGFYFLVCVWEHVHFMLLMGRGRFVLPSLLYLARSIVAGAAIPTCLAKCGAAGPFLALTIVTVGTTAWMLPLLAWWSRHRSDEP
jgi:hypothetical protein